MTTKVDTERRMATDQVTWAQLTKQQQDSVGRLCAAILRAKATLRERRAS